MLKTHRGFSHNGAVPPGSRSTLPPADRVGALLAEAARRLDEGRGGEAADIFGRVLLLDPTQAEARAGLETARADMAEARRRLDGRLEEARSAIPSDPERARRILDQVLRDGGDRDGAHALLDRLDGRAGRVAEAPRLPPDLSAAALAGDSPRRRPTPISRQAFVAACTVAFVALAVGLAFSWDRLVGGLVQNPSPSSVSLPPSTGVPAPTVGEEALARARDLMQRGDPAGALAVLDRIPRDEPAYPLARRLRADAVAALGRPAGR